MTQSLSAPAMSLLQQAQAAGNGPASRRLLEQALGYDPDHPILCNAMGMNLLANDPAEAAIWFARAIRGDADAPHAVLVAPGGATRTALGASASAVSRSGRTAVTGRVIGVRYGVWRAG